MQVPLVCQLELPRRRSCACRCAQSLPTFWAAQDSSEIHAWTSEPGRLYRRVDMFSLEVLEVVGGLSPQASQAMMQDGATLGGLLRVWKAEGRRPVVGMFRLEGVPPSG
mmetsp:Transcript_16094/g.39167  ORF Transcript_16094/g.39167 Transcript_16094/m.39167 type:complete len:109 (-) Transcript_16094:105-431(-)